MNGFLEYISDLDGYKIFSLLLILGLCVGAVLLILGAVRYFISAWPKSRALLFMILAIAIGASLIFIFPVAGPTVFFGLSSAALLIISFLVLREVQKDEETFYTYRTLIITAIVCLVLLYVFLAALFSPRIFFLLTGCFNTLISVVLVLRLI